VLARDTERKRIYCDQSFSIRNEKNKSVWKVKRKGSSLESDVRTDFSRGGKYDIIATDVRKSVEKR